MLQSISGDGKIQRTVLVAAGAKLHWQFVEDFEITAVDKNAMKKNDCWLCWLCWLLWQTPFCCGRFVQQIIWQSERHVFYTAVVNNKM
jgi:hypothetical protein